jgi:hypothetical protein
LYSETNQQIIGFYENLLMNKYKETPSTSLYANSISETIHNKKFKFPIVLEISSIEIENSKIGVIKEEIIITVIYIYYILILLDAQILLTIKPK